MRTISEVDPFRCRMWDLHDRLSEHIDEVTCRAEIASIAKHGQLVPVLGRPRQRLPEFDVELIYGARRLFVARYLKRPLLIELRDVDDAQAIVAMDIENRHRMDISPYERGLSYLKWLRAGYFRSQEDLSKALKVSPSQVCRLVKLAQLPAVIIGAFPSPTEIRETWALDLAARLDDKLSRDATISRARLVASQNPRPSAVDAYRELLTATIPGRRPRRQLHDEVIRGRDGKPLFRIRQQSRTLAVLLPVERMSAERLNRLRAAVATALTD